MRLRMLMAVVMMAGGAFAEAPKPRMAYGAVLFGDGEKEAGAHFAAVMADQNRRHLAKPNAADLVPYLVYKGTKFPPKLASRYHATMVGLQLGGGVVAPKDRFPIRTVTMAGNSHQAEQYQKDVKADWEVLRDIAASKFENHTDLAPFPPVAPTADGATPTPVVTDQWVYEGVEIKLTLMFWRGGSCSAVLTATDTMAAQ